ncbi:N-acetyltransferase [bacterium]|nr:N-acetyltransferase [bacterium]
MRPERESDADAIRDVNRRAFGQPQEAALVDALRRDGAAFVSLVAEADGVVKGHILFSPVVVEGGSVEGTVVALAPMAVVPEWQREGVGGALVREGLAACRRAGATAVIVLGHPEYYPRFGFRAAAGYRLRCEFPAPPEVYFALELAPGALAGDGGVVRYHPAFAEV